MEFLRYRIKHSGLNLRFILKYFLVVSYDQVSIRMVNLEKTIRNLIDSNNWSNHWRNSCENIEVTQLFLDLSKAFDSIHSGMTKWILLAYGFPQRNCYSYNDAV